jgi:hypothetical protein
VWVFFDQFPDEIDFLRCDADAVDDLFPFHGEKIYQFALEGKPRYL